MVMALWGSDKAGWRGSCGGTLWFWWLKGCGFDSSEVVMMVVVRKMNCCTLTEYDFG